MDTYEIEQSGGGWFRVVVTNQTGQSWTKDGFVSRRAAEKWVGRTTKANSERTDA